MNFEACKKCLMFVDGDCKNLAWFESDFGIFVPCRRSWESWESLIETSASVKKVGDCSLNG